MPEVLAHLALSASAFLSATLLPGTSEAGFLAAVSQWPRWTLTLFLTAAIANTAGSAVNWWLGTQVDRFAGRRWFPFGPHHLARARELMARYGIWCLLFAWVPVVGDPLTLVAGTLRVPFATFVLLVGLGKALRYGLLLWGLKALS